MILMVMMYFFFMGVIMMGTAMMIGFAMSMIMLMRLLSMEMAFVGLIMNMISVVMISMRMLLQRSFLVNVPQAAGMTVNTLSFEDASQDEGRHDQEKNPGRYRVGLQGGMEVGGELIACRKLKDKKSPEQEQHEVTNLAVCHCHHHPRLRVEMRQQRRPISTKRPIASTRMKRFEKAAP